MIERQGGKRPGAGRPIGDSGIRTRARQYVDSALSSLDDVAKNSNDPTARVEAAKAIIAAAAGRAGSNA